MVKVLMIKNPTHYYANQGIFNVTHIGYNSNGTSETLIINNFIDQYNLDPSFNLTKMSIVTTILITLITQIPLHLAGNGP